MLDILYSLQQLVNALVVCFIHVWVRKQIKVILRERIRNGLILKQINYTHKRTYYVYMIWWSCIGLCTIATTIMKSPIRWVPIRPPHPVVPEMQLCHALCGAWHCPGHTQSFVQKCQSPREAYCRGEAWCNIGGWGFHPAPPVHSSHHGEWHPILWLRGRCYRPWVGCMHLSVSPLACGSNELDHHCETAWSEIHHWRHSAWSPAFCEFSPHMAASPVIQSQSWIPGGRPRPIASIQKHVYNSPNWQPPPKLADHLHAQTKSRRGKRLSLTIQMKCLASRAVVRLLLLPHLCWCGRSVSRLRRKIVLTHPCDTPDILATSCWQKPPADNLTIRTRIFSCKLRGMMPSESDRKCRMI